MKVCACEHTAGQKLLKQERGPQMSQRKNKTRQLVEAETQRRQKLLCPIIFSTVGYCDYCVTHYVNIPNGYADASDVVVYV